MYLKLICVVENDSNLDSLHAVGVRVSLDTLDVWLQTFRCECPSHSHTLILLSAGQHTPSQAEWDLCSHKHTYTNMEKWRS